MLADPRVPTLVLTQCPKQANCIAPSAGLPGSLRSAFPSVTCGPPFNAVFATVPTEIEIAWLRAAGASCAFGSSPLRSASASQWAVNLLEVDLWFGPKPLASSSRFGTARRSCLASLRPVMDASEPEAALLWSGPIAVQSYSSPARVYSSDWCTRGLRGSHDGFEEVLM